MGFVVLGLVAILVGAVCRWTWVRNIYFRVVHLAMIAIVVGEALAGVPCPLTIWEKQLRVRAGQATYPGDFLGYWVHRLIFYQAEPWVFTLIYAIFGLAVVAALGAGAAAAAVSQSTQRGRTSSTACTLMPRGGR